MTRHHARHLAASRMYLMEEDVEQIQRLVRSFENQALRVLDLGAGSGTTALAVLDEREDAIITTVDIEADNVNWAEKAVRNCYPSADWVGVVSDAAETSYYGRSHTIDLLLHDAGHERVNVEADLRAWLPYLSPGSLIWVHDFLPPPATWGPQVYPGVKEAIDVLIEEGLLRRYPGEHIGMGWVGMRS